MDDPSSRLSPIHDGNGDENESEDTEEDSPLTCQATEIIEGDTEGFFANMPPPEVFDYEDPTRPETCGTEHQTDIVQPLGQSSSIALVSSHQETHDRPVQSQGTESEIIPPLPSTQGTNFGEP